MCFLCKVLQHNILLPKTKNLISDSFHYPMLLPGMTSDTFTLITFILLVVFLHFAYGIKDYLPFFCSFVNFIDNNMRDSLQCQISFQPSQQHTGSAVQQSGSWGLERWKKQSTRLNFAQLNVVQRECSCGVFSFSWLPGRTEGKHTILAGDRTGQFFFDD